MQQELKAFQKKLTNLSGSNKSILQLRLSTLQDFDLNELDFLNSQSSFSIVEFLFSAKKKVDLCAVNDSRNAKVNDSSKGLKKILRQTDALLEERGVKELYIGWPFVEGKLKDGSKVRCPLLFFPVDLTQKEDTWRLEKRSEEQIAFNKSFFLAYSLFNETALDDNFIEHTFEDFDDAQHFRNYLYDLLKNSPVEINFNSALFENKLKSFHPYKKDEFEHAFKNGILKLENTAVLGIYPQSGSYLVPDYEYWLQHITHPSFEDFFLSKTLLFEDKFRQLSSIKEEQTYAPYDIDASQELALKSIKLGNSLVVQGPPGTGKSQLICNLIADFISRGKSVLVVSQKRVALEVVHERLKEKEMGDFVGVIHDFKNDRKKIYHQVEKQISNLSKYEQLNNGLDTIYLEREYLQACRRIDQLCEVFDEYKKALFDTKECGVSAKELYVTSSLTQPFFKTTQEYHHFDIEKLNAFCDKLEWLFPHAKAFGHDDFSWKERKSFASLKASDCHEIKQVLKNGYTYQLDFSTKIKTLLGEAISIEESRWILDRKPIILDLLNIINTPRVYNLFTAYIKIKTDINQLTIQEQQLLDCFKGQGVETSISTHEIGEFQSAVDGYLYAQKNIFRKLKWHFFNKDKYKIKRVLVANNLSWNSEGFRILISRIDNRLNLEHQLTKIRESKWIQDYPSGVDKESIRTWFDEHLAALEAKSISAELRSFIQYIPFEQHRFIEVDHIVNQLLNWCSVAASQLESWEKFLTPRQIKRLLDDQDHGQQLEQAIDEHFDNLCLFDKAKELLTTEENILLEKLIESTDTVSEAQTLLQNSIRIAWIEHIEAKHPILKTVSTLKFEQEEKELQACVKKKKALSKDILLLKIRERTYRHTEYNRLNNRVTYRELEHQVSKKKKIWPVRKTIAEFQQELFHLIPCWMASPEAVSAIFPMDMRFDLVIFDEASQCFTEKGLPAIFRAKQLMISGDKHQLSPNDLYQVRFEEEEEVSSDVEIDSLLDLSSKYLMQVQLMGHYRSESLDLIDFSNRHFYDNTLKMIPHFNKINAAEPGISYKKVDGIWENGVNQKEAEKVVETIFELMQLGETSIGVITFNYKQQNLILDLVEARSITERCILPESFFVKNIENVQGDERDIILFSIAYAENSQGKVNAHFGSLNMEKGENRLNVAITRARRKIYVFSSIYPQQLQVDDTKHEGPKLLKSYLQYAYTVSNGNYKPTIRTNHNINNNFLSTLIKSSIGIKNSQFELPFADVCLQKECNIEAICLTEDALYFNSLSAKDYHAYTPLAFKYLGWKVAFVKSRNFWNNPEKEASKILNKIS